MVSSMRCWSYAFITMNVHIHSLELGVTFTNFQTNVAFPSQEGLKIMANFLLSTLSASLKNLGYKPY